MTLNTMQTNAVQFAVARALNNAPVMDDAQLDQLALLTHIEYGQVRVSVAKELGIPVNLLDDAIADRKRQIMPATTVGNGRPLELPAIVLADAAVNGEAMLNEVVSALTNYVILPEHAALAIALWIIRAHSDDAFSISPRLAVLSPVKRCGKTTLLELIAKLVPRPLSTSNVTASVIFRTIEKYHPTLLIDEADSFLPDNEELRGILNSGHRRESAHVLRTVGDDYEPRQFSTWCPMVLAGIGTFPETIEDRSILVAMRRKRPGEAVHVLRWNSRQGETVKKRLDTIASAIARWAFDHATALRTIEPQIPESLNDRAADNWHPLLTIAERIGAQVAEQARTAAAVLSTSEIRLESKGVELLGDIAELFQNDHRERFTSQALCDQLTLMEERPWSDFRRGKPISPNQLARLLRDFSVHSRSIRFESGVQRGYERADFVEAFERYLATALPSKCNTATTLSHSDESKLSQSATDLPCSTSENAGNSAPDEGRSTVALRNAQTEIEEVIDLVG
jgi:putative DNA primase/helicase